MNTFCEMNSEQQPRNLFPENRKHDETGGTQGKIPIFFIRSPILLIRSPVLQKTFPNTHGTRCDIFREVQMGRCRTNVAHLRQSGPDSALDFQSKVLKTFEVVPSSLGIRPQHAPRMPRRGSVGTRLMRRMGLLMRKTGLLVERRGYRCPNWGLRCPNWGSG